MSQDQSAARRIYLHEFLDQLEYLNEATIFIWICGTVFTRLAAGVWFGSRPTAVLLTILTLVYIFMHRGRYHTMLIRFPVVLLLLFVGQTYIIHAGSFFSAKPFVLSWTHLALAWAAMIFSFLFHGDDFPSDLYRWKTKLLGEFSSKLGKRGANGNIIPFRKASGA